MKKSALLAVVIVGLALLTAGCDLFGGDKDDWPLKVGNIWNYKWTQILADSVRAETSLATVKQEATAEVTLGTGDKAFKLVTTVTTEDTTMVFTSYARKDGDKYYSYSDTSDTTPDLVIDGPLTLAKTWQVSQNETALVLAKENVTVPAGTYNAWKVSLTEVTGQDTSVVFNWYAEGTGMVKYLAGETHGGMTFTMTMVLTSATIK